MDPELLSRACSLYETSPTDLIPLSGGHSNAVYKFPFHQTSQSSTYGVLRIGVEDCPPNQTLGMLEWVHFLDIAGAPVTAPLASIQGHLLERLEHDGKYYTVTAFEKAEGTLAEDIPPGEWTNDLFRSIGASVGRFHRISAKYTPSSAALTRPHWYDSYEIHEALRLMPLPDDPVHEKITRLLDKLHLLPISPDAYGMIHDDLHFANFLILPGGQLAIIDFDDCGYGWFAIDVAMALFDVLVLYNPSNESAKQQFALQFMENYLAGYRQEKALPPFWLNQLPHYLKLKELCIYADLVANQVSGTPDSWVGRFMRSRDERVANDVPYVDINFSAL
jgi:amicoumacin kinase